MKDRSAPDSVRESDLPAKSIDDLPGDAETKARTTLAACIRSIGLRESTEYPGFEVS
jgi:hypothetical protein